IQQCIERNERVLVTTLTKAMAEELNEYLTKYDISSAYMHSDVKTLDRIRILDELRAGQLDVLVGVNLLREGLDLPEVSLVAILDADKEGFLRSHRSLTQTVGRAARNLNGHVIMYADKITDSMRQTIEETERRRSIQLAYNEQHGITPQAIVKARSRIVGLDREAIEDLTPAGSLKNLSSTTGKTGRSSSKPASPRPYSFEDEYNAVSLGVAADPVVRYMSADELRKNAERTEKEMLKAAKAMDFLEAARLRDEMIRLNDLARQYEESDRQ
ncbi:MAG: UvrB/UvrC motif-containing protein, partial [Muribaculaceae bacterium]|nr:UvrB/UvrC motif-containing protein [Muribaculaceae bacterium]